MGNTEKVTSIKKTETNRANARKSTGPRTAEGKRAASLNALRHGLTSHLIVLPTEDAEAYNAYLAKHHEMFLPETEQERDLVETLANTKWRLNRCGALEANLFALGHQEQAPQDLVEAGLAAALTFQESADTFLKLSMYEQRLMRTYQTTRKELLTLQESRRETAKSELFAATRVRNLHIQHGLPFHPGQFGFVSTDASIERLIRKQDALEGHLDLETGPAPTQG